MLKLQDITFAIDGKPLLAEASAVIPAGHKVGIVGRNGTGKQVRIAALVPDDKVDAALQAGAAVAGGAVSSRA